MAQPGLEPGAGGPGAGWADTLDDDYDVDSIRKDINIVQPRFNAQCYTLPWSTKSNNAPDLPFKDHPAPSMINLSNKFRQKGPNKIMYPPKNGPIALIKKYGGDPFNGMDLPIYDPFDELTFEIEQEIITKYNQELTSLNAMGYKNKLQNIRALNRHKTLKDAQNELQLVNNPKYTGIFIGDIVVRGPDWKWGNQDGGITHKDHPGFKGTIRGIRRWHPNDKLTDITEVVVLWDHGLYGNYRFNYRGAYDIRVIARLNLQSIQMEPICVGDTVCRRQSQWRWGNQDGGLTNNNSESFSGTIIELYASPAPFEGGARIAVAWDKDREIWQLKANQYKERKEAEEKDGNGIDLSLDEFKYDNNIIHVNDNNKNGNNDDDEKKEEFPSIPDIPNPLSDEPILSPSSAGQGAKMITAGIETDDPWPLHDDYSKWGVADTADWIRALNDDFLDYGDTAEQCDISGKDFKEFGLMTWWITKIGVDKEEHAKALAAASKYRMDRYQYLKDNPQMIAMIEQKKEENDNSNKPKKNVNNDNNNNNNNNNNNEDQAPPAFAFGGFDIPMMDESLLDNHLQVPNQNDGGNTTDNEGGEEGGGEGGGPGLTDDEAPDNTEPAAAAPAAFSGLGMNNNNNNNNNNNKNIHLPKPFIPGSGQAQKSPSPMPPGSEQQSKTISRGKKGKRLYFWQKVMRKEEKLMEEFARNREKHEYFHITHGQYAIVRDKNNENDDYKLNNYDDEDEYEWKEPDFDELLSKPLPKYRWGIQYNYDLQIDTPKQYASNREYLMIDDRVKRGRDFTIDEKIGNYKSDFGIVLKIEQWDDTRLDPKDIRGDKIYLTWSSHRPFRFNYTPKNALQGTVGAFDIEFFKRGQVFALDYSHIRVGDRVSRGFSWTDDEYGGTKNPDDGGQGQSGTVTAVQYVLQVTGIIAKVKWHKNDHINLYSWGFKKIFDIRRIQ